MFLCMYVYSFIKSKLKIVCLLTFGAFQNFSTASQSLQQMYRCKLSSGPLIYCYLKRTNNPSPTRCPVGGTVVAYGAGPHWAQAANALRFCELHYPKL